jgi:hypothetical protein
MRARRCTVDRPDAVRAQLRRVLPCERNARVLAAPWRLKHEQFVVWQVECALDLPRLPDASPASEGTVLHGIGGFTILSLWNLFALS